MKKIIALLGAASLLTLSSCDLAMLGEGTMGRRDTQRIERGMSQEQVYSLMGDAPLTVDSETTASKNGNIISQASSKSESLSSAFPLGVSYV